MYKQIMRKVEVKTLFLEKLKEIFVPKGYKPITAANIFKRKTDTVFHEYFFAILDYYDTQKIADGFGLRLEPVETILKTAIAGVFPDWDEKNDETSVRTNYGRLKFNKINFYYPDIHKAEEAQAVLSTMTSFMLEEGLPLLDRYSDIRNINRDLNVREKIDVFSYKDISTGSYPFYLFRQTIIARLMQDPIEAYLIMFTRGRILKHGETAEASRYLAAFESLVSYLDTDQGLQELEKATRQLLSQAE
jgi:hypothetical protein